MGGESGISGDGGSDCKTSVSSSVSNGKNSKYWNKPKNSVNKKQKIGENIFKLIFIIWQSFYAQAQKIVV